MSLRSLIFTLTIYLITPLALSTKAQSINLDEPIIASLAFENVNQFQSTILEITAENTSYQYLNPSINSNACQGCRLSHLKLNKTIDLHFTTRTSPFEYYSSNNVNEYIQEQNNNGGCIGGWALLGAIVGGVTSGGVSTATKTTTGLVVGGILGWIFCD